MFLTIVEIAQWVRPFGATIYLKVEISAILGAAFPPPGTDWREIFCTAKRTNVPLGCAKIHVNRCNESSLRGENADYWPQSKFKYLLSSLSVK